MQMPLLITGMYKKTTPLKVSGAFVWAQMKRQGRNYSITSLPLATGLLF